MTNEDYKLYLEEKFNGLHIKMDTHAHDTHDRLDTLNGKVGSHEKFIDMVKAVGKFIIGGIGIVATVVGIWFAIFHK